MSTPMQKQYNALKEKHQDAILLFRLGDFYEAFNEDAEQIAKVLNITLTGRGQGDNRIPMAGIPYHALENYLPKLIKAGLKVAIAEQITEPGQGKIVERDIVKIITSGTYTDEKNLKDEKNIYICALYIENHDNKKAYYLASIDLSIGSFFIQQFDNYQKLVNQIHKLEPAEILVQEKYKKVNLKLNNYHIEYLYNDDFDLKRSFDNLTKHFKTKNLKGFGIKENDTEIIPAGVLMEYIQESQKTEISHITKLQKINDDIYMDLDYSTIRNLELIDTIIRDKNSLSLFDVLNQCSTAMGKRMLRNWILQPLIDQNKIIERLDSVDYFFQNIDVANQVKEFLDHILDIERLIGKIGTGNINGRDLLALRDSLNHINSIHHGLENKTLDKDISHLLESLIKLIDGNKYSDISNLIEKSIDEECPVKFDNGGVIKEGYNAEIDEIRNFRNKGKDYITNLQTKEREVTGITSLKVKFNKVFGYYIEISKSNLNKVPENYIRKQTLVNAERFITDELKEYEEKVLNAEEKLIQLEIEEFSNIINKISEYISIIQEIAYAIAHIDCFINLAILSKERKYVKPKISENNNFIITNGRHPVIEILRKEKYIPNDVNLNEENKFIILTGPNMSGKSTYIRKVALISLMAQIGSFVPADSAELNIVDRIFTRVGAADNLSAGESTFMVEMNETANILNNASSNSLIILDEVGRGTSTYDGVAIAWSIVEYIHNKVKAKTLFATHYHELIKLENKLQNLKNYHVHVTNQNDKVIFTHHIKEGGMNQSYGVHVAEMAGVPDEVTKKAKEILEGFEKQSKKVMKGRTKKIENINEKITPDNIQIELL